MEELIDSGFMHENIDLSNRRATDSTFTTGTGRSTGTSGTAGTGTARDYDTDYDESMGDKVRNFFGSLFGNDSPDTEKYSTAASNAQAILTVQADSAERAEEAREILDDNGAIDVDERASQFTGRTGTTTTTDTTPNDLTNRAGTRDHLDVPIVEEELQVGKRQVNQGGVRVKSRIIEKPVEETVRLREEHVTVNRQPVDRPIDPGAVENFKEGEFEITEHAEKPVVSKQARVKENVSIDKNVEERDEVVRDKVRRSDVDVQKIDNDTTFDENTRSKGARR